jgi:hypothetical protein
MYWNVPTMLPAPVMGELTVGAALAAMAPTVATGRALASPKSSSLAPLFVSMMLPGFRSR